MSLAPGARIGVFEVVARLGSGGMGDVYRARDMKLDREVALKVLPPLFTSDPERLARFEREAKVLAVLNHPNIAQVYGFEGTAIAMELVEGPTLDDIIRGEASGVPLDRALPIMRQIAAALETAHDQGIVHRDLKPANVKVREDGTVKVLDFGLAKALTSDADGAPSGVSNSPTLTARSTQLGVILGTAAYMAPEQAKGRAVDRRADVWAFGAVFFEVLAGRRAFEGEDVSDVLAAVLKSDPDWSALPADLPAPVRRLLRRCLEKDAKRRLRDVGEGLLQLDEGLASGSTASSMSMSSGLASSAAIDAAVAAPAAAAPKPFWRRALPVAAAVVLTAGASVAVRNWNVPVPPTAAPVRFVFDAAPVGLYLTSTRRDLAISPDGQSVVYSAIPPGQGSPSLYLRRLDQLDTAPLRGAESAIAPFFSADGQWVGFVSSDDQTAVKKVPLAGGPALPVCKVTTTLLGAAWLADGTILLGAPNNPLLRVPEAGGTPEPVTELDKTKQETDHLWPSAVEGTSLVLFVVNAAGNTPISAGQLAVVDLSSRRTVRLGVTGSHPRYVASGHIVYAVADGSLRAVRFDPGSLSVSGTPAPVVDSVGVKGSGGANFDVSREGRLVYAGGGVGGAARSLVWVDRTGRETNISAAPRNYFYARVAPDNRRLTLDVRDQEEDIWIWDIARETMTRLTDKAGADQYGLWTPTGERVVFSSAMAGRQELFSHRPDGVGQPEQLTDTAAEKLTPFPNAITKDGKQVIFRATIGGKNDLFIANVGGTDKKVRKLLGTEHDERNAALSPDGKLMAFESDLSGKFEVYVRPFPDVDSRQWPVSTAGGSEPVWSPLGRELFYLAADNKLMAVPVLAGPEFGLGKPTVLFDAASYFFGGQGRNYDVSPDGKRFVMVKNPSSGVGSSLPITIVLNWVDELRGRLK